MTYTPNPTCTKHDANTCRVQAQASLTLARLEARAVDDLHVDGHLAAVVGDDQDTDAAATRLESLLQTAPEAALVDDGQVLLDIASLGHGNDAALLHVEDAVLLEHGAEHGLDDDA